jgi:tetratricopeptide (TPR) repeat protein
MGGSEIMNEAQYISELEQLWPVPPKALTQGWESVTMADLDALEGPAGRALDVADEAVAACPLSPRLWCMRGELIKWAEKYELEESLHSFMRAIEADPAFARAYESVGDYYDAIKDQPEAALPWYERAIELGGDADAYYGRARAIAQTRGIYDALASLQPEACPYFDDPVIREISTEIAEGDWTC